jgi:hypothetical protein
MQNTSVALCQSHLQSTSCQACCNMSFVGRAMAQVVSCQQPTMEAWVRSQVKSYRICGGQNGIGAGFL